MKLFDDFTRRISGFIRFGDRWITVHPNGDDEEGRPVLISDNGIIQAGMGGKFNGKPLGAWKKAAPKAAPKPEETAKPAQATETKSEAPKAEAPKPKAEAPKVEPVPEAPKPEPQKAVPEPTPTQSKPKATREEINELKNDLAKKEKVLKEFEDPINRLAKEHNYSPERRFAEVVNSKLQSEKEIARLNLKLKTEDLTSLEESREKGHLDYFENKLKKSNEILSDWVNYRNRQFFMGGGASEEEKRILGKLGFNFENSEEQNKKPEVEQSYDWRKAQEESIKKYNEEKKQKEKERADALKKQKEEERKKKRAQYQKEYRERVAKEKATQELLAKVARGYADWNNNKEMTKEEETALKDTAKTRRCSALISYNQRNNFLNDDLSRAYRNKEIPISTLWKISRPVQDLQWFKRDDSGHIKNVAGKYKEVFGVEYSKKDVSDMNQAIDSAKWGIDTNANFYVSNIKDLSPDQKRGAELLQQYFNGGDILDVPKVPVKRTTKTSSTKWLYDYSMKNKTRNMSEENAEIFKQKYPIEKAYEIVNKENERWGGVDSNYPRRYYYYERGKGYDPESERRAKIQREVEDYVNAHKNIKKLSNQEEKRDSLIRQAKERHEKASADLDNALKTFNEQYKNEIKARKDIRLARIQNGDFSRNDELNAIESVLDHGRKALGIDQKKKEVNSALKHYEHEMQKTNEGKIKQYRNVIKRFNEKFGEDYYFKNYGKKLSLE